MGVMTKHPQEAAVTPPPEPAPPAAPTPATGAKPQPKPMPTEHGGPKGPEPTRYGDWEQKGRVTDF